MQADVCGFWSFPRLAPSYQPPDRLIQFLSKCQAEGKPVYVVGLGSMPELGLVQVLSCLTLANGLDPTCVRDGSWFPPLSCSCKICWFEDILSCALHGLDGGVMLSTETDN